MHCILSLRQERIYGLDCQGSSKAKSLQKRGTGDLSLERCGSIQGLPTPSNDPFHPASTTVQVQHGRASFCTLIDWADLHRPFCLQRFNRQPTILHGEQLAATEPLVCFPLFTRYKTNLWTTSSLGLRFSFDIIEPPLLPPEHCNASLLLAERESRHTTSLPGWPRYLIEGF